MKSLASCHRQLKAEKLVNGAAESSASLFTTLATSLEFSGSARTGCKGERRLYGGVLMPSESAGHQQDIACLVLISESRTFLFFFFPLDVVRLLSLGYAAPAPRRLG